MAEAIVSRTIEMLRNSLIQEASFLWGIRNQVQDIQTELQKMQCFLKDADKRQYEDERVLNWVRNVRNLAYKTENVIETYVTKVESGKGKGRIQKALKRFVFIFDEWVNLHKFGLEFENIKSQIASLTKSLQTYGIKIENEGESSNAASKDMLRQTFSHDIEECFVGMQNDIDRLVSLMVDGDKYHRIISIYGMGGLGKTTVAKQVFNHMVVQNCFESFAWVTISQKFRVNNILQEILGQLDLEKSKDEIKRMDYRELVQELCRIQREKKCLVVLDDIWKTEDWTIISRAFPETAVNCKVLLTTRIQAVAEIGIPHKLKLFSEEEGWQLLKRKALIGANIGEYEEIGKQTVRKCGYLPLAISVIGGILRKKRTLEEWKVVNKDIDSYLRCGEGIEENHQVMQILNLSYEDLPYQLKPCFLYLACYPEDTEINLRRLYWKWIAEGMVLSKDQRRDETLMEVAERYLNELASRSLVQVQLNELSLSSRYISCRLHDLVHDLCLRKCKEEDFLNFMVFEDNNQPISNYETLRGNACRFVIYGSKIEDNVAAKVLQKASENTRLYSLRHFGTIVGAQEVSKDLGNLRFLRVLELEGLKFSNMKLLHKAIKKLIHVRFLSFINCILDEVPSSIAKLPYLQTFCLVALSSKVKAPNVFWKLKSLIHLVLLGCNSVCESKIRLDCSGLQTLVHDDSHSIEVKSLSKLTNLRIFSLCVKDNESLSLIINYIEDDWCNVQDITLRIYEDCDFISTTEGSILLHNLFMCRAIQCLDIWNVHIRELPEYELDMLASSDLVDLCLYDCYIEKDPMPILERFPKLKRLQLLHNSFSGDKLICSSIGFPILRHLFLEGLPNLKKWRIEDGTMPNLSSVSIKGCLELEMIPDGMRFLKEIRKLEIDEMPVEFKNRICGVNGEEGIDFHKVSHVPLISIAGEVDYQDL